MSTMKIQDLNYDKSTTMTLELSEAGSVYGGVTDFGLPIFGQRVNSFGQVTNFGLPIFGQRVNSLGQVTDFGLPIFGQRVNSLGNALAES